MNWLFAMMYWDNQQESVQFYQQYIDNEPYSYAAWYNLGNAYTKLSLF